MLLCYCIVVQGLDAMHPGGGDYCCDNDGKGPNCATPTKSRAPCIRNSGHFVISETLKFPQPDIEYRFVKDSYSGKV